MWDLISREREERSVVERERDEMEHLLGLGVDGLMTDRPTLLAEVLSMWDGPSEG